MKPSIYLLIRVVFLFSAAPCLFSQGLSSGTSHPQFIKVNSGTRANIRRIVLTSDRTGYFLAEKIFRLNKTGWARVEIPISQPVSLFSAVGTDDLWLTVNTTLNNSELYHYVNNRLEKISSPFANEINAMHFADKNSGNIAGWNEMAVFSNGIFTNITSPAVSEEMIKIVGISMNRFWALCNPGELFLYENKAYKRILPEEKVVDFCFYSSSEGLVLCESGIFTVTGDQCKKIFSHPELKMAVRIEAKSAGDIWIAGRNGMIRRLIKGNLHSVAYAGKENLNDIFLSSNNEIWIAGDMGILLYSGSMPMDQSQPDIPGFVKNKLYEYGGQADDEYGVAIADFNGDGNNDIYSVCIFSADRLYINYPDSVLNSLQSRRFREEAIKRGASGISKYGSVTHPSELHLGVAAADVDNDGDQDLYLCCLNGKNKLLLNDGNGYFRDVSDQENRACEDLDRSNTAVFADIDNDGNLDLFVTSEKASNKLFLNDGTGHFRDVTAGSGLETNKGGMCASFADVNNDGLPDLCVSFWFSANRLYLNETADGKVRFRDVTAMTDISKADPARSNAVVFGDINNDGSPDLLITGRNAPNKLYLNNGQGVFRDVSRQYLGDRVYMSNGAVIADFDLDGYNDIYITNVGENILYRNISGQYFTDATAGFNAESYGYGTGCATGDIDGDGDVDLYMANYINGNSVLLQNSLEQKRSVTFILSGTRSNRDAIGAKVFLYKTDSAGKEQIAGYREISGGGGYGSVSAREVIFGIQPGQRYRASIKFPSSANIINIKDIHTGDVIRIKEENGMPAFVSVSLKSALRLVSDPENQLTIIKYLFVFGIIAASLIFQKRRGTIRIRSIVIIYGTLCILFVTINQILLFAPIGVSLLIPPLVVVIGLVIFHLLAARIRLKRKAYKEKQEVRENISRDLHDDLASTLGSIAIYSNTLVKKREEDLKEDREEGREEDRKEDREEGREEGRNEIASKIIDLTQDALQSITDIIWMTSPRNDSLKSLLSKIRNYYFDLFNDNHIRFSADIEVPETDYEMQDPLRQNVFLILKEAAANCIKHSCATLVTLEVYCTEGVCNIYIKDNGQGFNPSVAPGDIQGGNGLINMRRRAAESGISLTVNSEPGSGTEIIVNFKMTQTGY